MRGKENAVQKQKVFLTEKKEEEFSENLSGESTVISMEQIEELEQKIEQKRRRQREKQPRLNQLLKRMTAIEASVLKPEGVY
jgi:hypothetical protein